MKIRELQKIIQDLKERLEELEKTLDEIAEKAGTRRQL